MSNDPVSVTQMASGDAIDAGATALFDEKYGDTVRVVRIGDVEHGAVRRYPMCAPLVISVFSRSSPKPVSPRGVRRIEAQTGVGALAFVRQLEEEQRAMASLLKAEGGKPLERLEKLLARQRELQREIESLQGKLNAAASQDLLASLTDVNGMKLLAVQVQVEDAKALRDLSDTLKDRVGEGIVVLGTVLGDKANLLVAVTKNLSSRVKAGDLIKKLAPLIGGSGGGKPELAQAGGSRPEKLGEALAAAAEALTGL